MLQGKTLYAQIWNNKPPLHLWTVAILIKFFGTSEAALHSLTFVSGLLTLAAVAYACDKVLGRRRTAFALLLTAVLLGTPILDAELLIPESLLIAPVTWAGAILLRRFAEPDARAWPRWPVAVGALVAVAIAYQQTALAEACAFGFILLVTSRGNWRRFTAYAATVAALTAAWLIPTAVSVGASTVAYALAGFYVRFTRATGTGRSASFCIWSPSSPPSACWLSALGSAGMIGTRPGHSGSGRAPPSSSPSSLASPIPTTCSPPRCR